MNDSTEKSAEIESPEAQAEEELLKLGIQCVPENIKAVLALQKTPQHPEGFDDIVNAETFEELGGAMKQKDIGQFIHAEGPDLWTHCKMAMTLAGFLPISEEKKADLKLIMLYHDLGKSGMRDTPEIKTIQRKELGKGKLYKVAKGHAMERSDDIEDGFRANGIDGKKLKFFMRIVQNHMETRLNRMEGHELVKLFGKFGTDDEKIKDAVEMLAFAVQVDSNACSRLEFSEEGEVGSQKEVNTTGADFDKIWERYQEAKKQSGARH